MKYKTNWWTAILGAIAVHIFVAVLLVFVVPKILPAQKIPSVTEMNWVDVDLVDDLTAYDDEFVAIESVESEASTEFEFAPIELPPLEIPTFEPLPQIEVVQKPVEPPKNDSPKEEPPKVDAEKISEPTDEPTENAAWVESPIVVSAVYPTESFGYAGEIMILATIGKDGKVKHAELVFPTGNVDADNAAQVAATKWTFKPALDKDGKPTECSYSIVFNFKKIFSTS